MKKIIFTLVFIMTSVMSFSQSETTSTGGISFETTFGIDVSTKSFDNVKKTKKGTVVPLIVSEDVVSDGNVIIPANTVIEGVVKKCMTPKKSYMGRSPGILLIEFPDFIYVNSKKVSLKKITTGVVGLGTGIFKKGNEGYQEATATVGGTQLDGGHVMIEKGTVFFMQTDYNF